MDQGDPRLDVLADAVAARRKELGLTQQTLARLAHVTVSTIRRVERGSPVRQRGDALHRIQYALQWPADAVDRLLHGRPLESAEQDDDIRRAVRSAELAASAWERVDELTRIVRQQERRVDQLEHQVAALRSQAPGTDPLAQARASMAPPTARPVGTRPTRTRLSSRRGARGYGNGR